MTENFNYSPNIEIIISKIMQYHNYEFFPSNIKYEYEFFQLCNFNYQTLVNFYMNEKEKEIEKMLKEEAVKKNKTEIIYYLLSKQNKIDEGFFLKCSYIEEIAIPSSIISIGDYTLFGQSSVNYIVIPSSVTSIGNNAFKGCFNLMEFTIPSSVISIGNYVFAGCSGLKKITILGSLTSIGDGAFLDCTKLKQITLPLSVKSIGKYSFKGCNSLEQIAIPFNLTSIGSKAFYNCFSLTKIEIPSSVESIGNNAFYGCCSLTELKIPPLITFIENYAFMQCSSFTEIFIPSSVTCIGNYSFAECSSLEQISISSSVTSIGNCSFAGCSSLKQISIPSSVKYIGNNAFSECSSLEIIEIPSSVISIGCSAFSGCTALKQISIPPSITSIGNCLFYQCKSLTKITIPSSVKTIGILAFFECSSLVDISIQTSDIDIGLFAFVGCSSLKKLNSDLVKIKSSANIDDYEINQFINRGGFTCVLKAVDKKTGQEFALKNYETNYLKDYQYFLQNIAISTMPGLIKVQRYRLPLSDEEKAKVKTLKIALKVSGKEIKSKLTDYIIFSDIMKNGDISLITRNYLKNQTIDKNKMNPTIRSKIIFGVASIMKYLHKMNIIVRDLKLADILLDDNLEPRINCFLLSKFVTDPINLEMCVGTPFYMAPELFADEDNKYGFPVDVYSYAFVLYLMFSNDLVFYDLKRIRSPQQFMRKIGSGSRPVKPEKIPENYWELIQRCWQQDPDDRPTFEEIVNILKDDKFALEEFGMKTDLQQLHEYQKRINID